MVTTFAFWKEKICEINCIFSSVCSFRRGKTPKKAPRKPSSTAKDPVEVNSKFIKEHVWNCNFHDDQSCQSFIYKIHVCTINCIQTFVFSQDGCLCRSFYCFFTSFLAIVYSRYWSILTIDINILLWSTRMRWESDFRIRCTVHACMYAYMLTAHTSVDQGRVLAV